MRKIAVVGILSLVAVGGVSLALGQNSSTYRMAKMDPAKAKVWLSLWERTIINDNPMRYCTASTGEAIGWEMMPFLRGFYYGYVATKSRRWVDLLVHCADGW